MKLLLLLLLLGVAGILLVPHAIHYGAFGSNDFIQYWAAFQTFIHGGNAYDPSQLLEFEKSVGFLDSRPMMFWAAPWTLLLLAPVLSFPFECATALWQGIGILLFLISLFLTTRIFTRPDKTADFAILIALPFCFLPFYDSLRLGQIASLLLIAISGFALSFATADSKPKHSILFSILAGMLLAVTTIKPHLFYLIYLAILYRSIQQGNGWLLLGFFVGLSLLILGTEILLPGATSAWISTFVFSETEALVVPRGAYLTPSLVGLLRSLLTDISIPPQAFSVLVPLISAVICWALLIRYRPKIDATLLLVLILPFSVFTAPYGWLFDDLVLSAAILALIFTAMNSPYWQRWKTLLWIFLGIFPLATCFFYFYVATEQHQLWFYPAAVAMAGAFWAYSARIGNRP